MKHVRSIISLAVSIAVLFSALPALSTSVSANSGIVVNTHQDSFSLNNDGICSLREAITIANQGFNSAYGCSGGSSGTDTITFAGNYTITLGSQLPAVASSIIIQGNGASNTIIQANAAPNTATYRVFEVAQTGSLTLDGLTVRHGRCIGSCAVASNSGGGILNAGSLTVSNTTIKANSASSGGGIRNRPNSSATLTNVTISANSAITGGGMANDNNSSLTLTNVTISFNTADNNGGGMDNNNSSLTLTNVTISANSADANGGGMYNYLSSPTLTNVTFNNNSADAGGGMYNRSLSSPTLTNVNFNGNSATTSGGGMHNESNSSPTLVNVTFSANSAKYGGGMYSYEFQPTLTNVTFNANFATFNGGGMYNYLSSPVLTNVTFSANIAALVGGGMFNTTNSQPTLTNVIIANSTNGDCVNISSSLNSASSHNLITNSGSNACGLTHGLNGNIIGQNPMLGALANNGGFTQTHALLTGSPAIDAGTNTGCPAADQRGVTRPQGSHCDIGAYESASISLPASPTFSDVPMSHPYWEDIEILYANGLTAGCSSSPLNFCPQQIMDRAQSAVFMLRGNFGNAYTPPDPPFTNPFSDNWSPGAWAQKWAQGMFDEGLTAGCSSAPLRFCPWDLTNREQAAVFGLRLKYGNAYVPPAATGEVFADMANPNHWGTKWAEQAYAEGLLPACGSSNGKPLFCPNSLVSRGLAAYMIVRAKSLAMP